MRPYFPQPRFAGGANFRESDAPNLGARFAPSKFERRQPKFFHRPKWLRCDSDPAGGATPQIAPPTRAPAGRGPTDARHSRHARSRSHHGHRSATVTPESRSRRLARCRAPRHCRLTVVSPLRLSTPPSRLLRSLRGARQRARLYTSDSLSNDGGPAESTASTQTAPTAPTAGLRRLRPALPASSANLRRDVQLGFRRRLRRRRPRLSGSARPGPTAFGTGPSSHVVTKVTVVCT